MGTAGAIVGGSVVGGLFGMSQSDKASKASSKASKRAAKAQEAASKRATKAQLEMYYQSRADLAPWREGGEWAIDRLRSEMGAGPGDYTKSPGYEFRLGEGIKAMERGAAARGNLLSGGQQKALTQYGQDYATQDYDNFLDRWYQSLTPYQSMAGMGQTSAGQTAGLGTQAGGNIARNYLMAGQAAAGGHLGAGQARASGYINQANILSGGVKSGVENYLMHNYLNRKPPARDYSYTQTLS